VSVIGVLAEDAAHKNTELNFISIIIIVVVVVVVVYDHHCMHYIKSCPATAMHAARGK
jgi:hypothetical protein